MKYYIKFTSEKREITFIKIYPLYVLLYVIRIYN